MKFNIVKRGMANDALAENTSWVCLDDIPADIDGAYCLESDDVVTEFIKEHGVLHLSEISALRKSLPHIYNPLLVKQDVILLWGDYVYRVPYLLIKHRHRLGLIDSYLEALGEDSLLFELSVKYTLTKDLHYINALINVLYNTLEYPTYNILINIFYNILYNIRKPFDLSVFNALNSAFMADGSDSASVFEQGLLKAYETIRLSDRTLTPPIHSEINQRYVSHKKLLESSGGEIYKRIKQANRRTQKNVILIHLESLSNEVYNNHIHNMPELERLARRSLRLVNYYSSATSSCMSLMDILYGNDFESDSFPVFDDMYLGDGSTYCKNMYQVFKKNGYDVLGVGYNEIKQEEVNQFNLWQVDNQKYEWRYSFRDFIKEIEDFIARHTNKQPFAMHIWNLMSHIGHTDPEINTGQTYIERMNLSYTSLDATIGAVIDCLDRYDLTDDTIVICYGDHGDDKWTRAINRGCTHIIEPYLNVIKCPAFILDSRLGSLCNFTDIVSATDIKNTALFLANVENRETFPYQGINIFPSPSASAAMKNRFAYSRSHLVNQQITQKIQSEWVSRLNNFSSYEHKNKSYCAVNRNYNMVVSQNGLELFMHANDPGNYNNLLNFFKTDQYGNIVHFDNHGAWRGHFRSIMMADDQIFDIIENYHILRTGLMERIRLKESLVRTSASNPDAQYNFFDLNLFNTVRERGFIWR